MDNNIARIEEIEKEIRETPYHKGTERHIGILRARLSKLKDQYISASSKGGGGGKGFAVKKQGDATVVLVGFPSVGKSTLLNSLTNAKSHVAPYSFTTVTVIPGMLVYKSARIQILDVPGLIEGASVGKGRGREILSVVRNADLLLLIADSRRPQDLEIISRELEKNGIRINKNKPKIDIKKTVQGGLRVNNVVRQDISSDAIKDICREYRLVNAEITIREKIDLERLVDVFSTSRVYTSAINVLSKIDLCERKREKIFQFGVNPILVSAEKGIGLNELKEAIWKKLELVRVYLKNSDKKTDFDEPLVVRKTNTLADILPKIGNEFSLGKKSAKIWGSGARFPGQSVSLNLLVQDEMEVEFV